MTITFRFDRKVEQGNTVVVMANAIHTKEGWVPVAAKLSADRQSASIVVDHLSWFQALEDLVGNTADTFMSEIRQSFDDLVDGSTAEADKPKCENEKQARGDGYTIDSSSKVTLYWCFGMQDGKRILKVVNRMRYPLDVRHPASNRSNSRSTSNWQVWPQSPPARTSFCFRSTRRPSPST